MVRRTALVLASVALGLAAATALVIILIFVVRVRSHRTAKPERPAPDCHLGPTTPGIDVSYYQETIDWQRVQRAGIRFAFIRLSDGAEQRDPMFVTNWSEARRAGLLRGAYLFFRPDQSIAAQADVMIASLRADRGDLPPVIDIEVDGGLPASAVAARARAWIDRVRDGLGVEPTVYTGGDLWRNGGAEPLSAQPLWIAHYTQTCPILPSAWSHWTFWQHTDRGAVPGIEGAVDLDLFAGTLGDLHSQR